MKNTIEELNPSTMEHIEKSITTALRQRGFNAPLTFGQSFNKKLGYLQIHIASEPFFIVPALFASVRIDTFGTRVRTDKENPDTLFAWICVHASYEHFGGGSNGCKIFDYMGRIGTSDEFSGVFDERIF